MTYSWFADKNSPYEFTDEEMRRWHVEERLQRVQKPHGRVVSVGHTMHL
jgi:hypothetical protein